jgi:hypothetical protein
MKDPLLETFKDLWGAKGMIRTYQTTTNDSAEKTRNASTGSHEQSPTIFNRSSVHPEALEG